MANILKSLFVTQEKFNIVSMIIIMIIILF